MKEDIAQIRSGNLRAWIDQHGTPQKERSYFSQLALGTASFGEKAARRIERDYNMGHMYLDTPQPAAELPLQVEEPQAAYEPTAAPGEAEDAQASHGQTWLVRVDMEEMELLSQFRERSRRGKDVIWAAFKVAEKQRVLTGLRRHNKG